MNKSASAQSWHYAHSFSEMDFLLLLLLFSCFKFSNLFYFYFIFYCVNSELQSSVVVQAFYCLKEMDEASGH